MFEYSLDNKRYHTLNYHMKSIFGERVFKASIDARMTCPNIDGRVGFGGCTFCASGADEFTGKGRVSQQIENERERIRKKHPDAKLIAYFQAHTNTYAPLGILRSLYEEALSQKGVVGISIATRPDCIADDVSELLADLSEKTYLTVELGLQSVHDRTAERINRGYSFDVFEKTFYKLKDKKIRTCVHLINGLIGEDTADMIKSAEVLSKMEPDAVKLHLLHIMRGTVCEKEYEKGLLSALSKEEYVNIVVEQIRRLDPRCVIERVTGDGKREELIAPLWSRAKISVLAAIDKRFAELDAYQGDKFNK